MKKYSSGCTFDCFDSCKFNVYKNRDGSLKLEGDKNHPFTKGFICKKGWTHLDFLNHPKRITTPKLKVNGKWEEITFKEALEIVSKKLLKSTSKEIIYYEQYGNGGLLKSIGEIFFNFYGGAWMSKGGPCWSAGIKAQKYDFGNSLSHSLSDLTNSKAIVVWGKNPANTTIHTMKAILDAKKKGAKIIAIDPIFTDTCKIADYYIKPKSGGDYYLALAISKLLIENKDVDLDFIETHSENFTEYKDIIESFSLESLIEKAGVTFEIVEFLKDIYKNKPASTLVGYGLQKYKIGGKAIRAIDALGMISGNIGIRGGGVNYANKLYKDILNTDPYNSFEKAIEREFFFNEFEKIVEKEGIKILFITKSNFLNQMPNLNKLTDTFKKIDFKVCIDIFFTETAKNCDLFIPSTATLESEDLLFSSMTNPYIIYKEQVVEPLNPLMDEYNFFMELAKNINLKGYPLVSKKEYIEKVIKNLDISIDTLINGYVTKEIEVPWKDFKFKTSSGKFEFLKPTFEKSKEVLGYRLITTHGKDTLFSPHFIDRKDKAIVYMNNFEKERNSFFENEEIILASQNGKIKARVKVDNGVPSDTVMMNVGWLKSQGNPNYLTLDCLSDIGGQIAYNETIVTLIKE